ncbi:glycosyltransferase family 2 protein [Aminipila butyrica]|uniref:Glycosyltransferase family 2 protein n=1 Tax=Aminipila butyrica TaxID=433296 RepID=A0A858BUR0_9FIRM|nr:glycosyltransferase family 2 protein [Aminipila butyrica]QIB69112.1 glycosyltransferase family 2 protein [Aminipila butyrica]
MSLTIFTPTYNRRQNLEPLYRALCAQSCMNFVWLIVDDGSLDDTGTYVEKWSHDTRLSITCIQQKNQGKHIAMRTGIQECKTEWFICVDSDDLLTPDAVERMYDNIVEKKNQEGIGFIYPRYGYNGVRQGGWIPEDIAMIHIMDAKELFNVAETAILLKTKYLKKIDIPQFPGENFLSEEIIYNLMAINGKIWVKKEKIYLAEYRDDGLTKSIFRMWVKNPKGVYLLLLSRYKASESYPWKKKMISRIKCIINYNAFSIAKHKSKFLLESPSILLSIATLAPSIFFYWKRYVKN